MIKEFFKKYINQIASACHRQPQRSFETKGHQSIVCVRCSSIYAGFFFTFLSLLFYGFYNAQISIFWSLTLVGPITIDGLTQRLNLRQSFNELRIITGFLLGSSFSFLIGSSIQKNFQLLQRKLLNIPNIGFLLFLSIFILIYLFLKRNTSPKSIYAIDSITILGSITLYAILTIATLKIIVNFI